MTTVADRADPALPIPGVASEPTVADPVLVVDQVDTLDELAEAMRRLRRRHARRHGARELTMRELARRTGYAYGAISEYLAGKALPPTDRFDVLIRELGASATEQRALATARDRVEETRRTCRNGLAPRELPPDVYGFVGRTAQLDALDRVLGRSGTVRGARIAGLVGTAGVGKTALAVHWAHRVGPGFPDGCLYLDLRGYDPEQPVPPAEALAAFLRSLGVSGGDIPPTEAERAGRYRTLMADRRMVVLLDNARDTDHVRPLVPAGTGTITLVTSRDALAGLVARYGAERIDVPPLSDTEAVDLLGLLLGERVAGEPAAADALAHRCAHLPLMLRLVAELAGARPRASLAQIDAELADVRQRLQALDAGGEPRSAIRAVFSWSYQNLPARTARAFRLFGLYPGHDLDAYAMAALAGIGLPAAQSLLQKLASSHLVQQVRPDRYRMHDLLRAYAQGLAARDQRTRRRAAMTRLLDQQLHACAVAMDLMFPFDRDRRPKVADPGWPVPPLTDPESAIAWLDIERANLVDAAVYAAGHQHDEHPSKLSAILVRYLDTGAHYHDAEQLYRHAALVAEPADRANPLTSLGIVCWRLGRYQEAATHQERALELARAHANDTEVGRALLGLGIAYWHLGLAAQTLDCGQQALELYRRTGDRIGQARVLGNLGKVHSQLGEYPVALEYHRQALALFRAAGDPAGSGNEACGLGVVLERQGRLTEASAWLRRALGYAGQIGYRECEAEARTSLGAVHLRLGRLDEALEEHQRALTLGRDSGDRTVQGYALGNLGTVHSHLGRHDKALDHHRRALRIAREIGDNRLAAELLNRLGDALLAADRPHRAARAYRQALHRTRGRDDPHQEAKAEHGLSRAGTALGDSAAARLHLDRAEALYDRLGVPEAATVRSSRD